MEENLNIFGKNQVEIGSLDKNLVLRTAGRVYIRYGRKYIELIDNKGEINVKIPKIITKVSSESEMKDNGFYLMDGNLYLCYDGDIFQITGIDGEYIKYNELLNLNQEQISTAQHNIGLTFKTINEAKNSVTNGIVFVGDKIYYIDNGTFREIPLNEPVKGINESGLDDHPQKDSSAILWIDGKWQYADVITREEFNLYKQEFNLYNQDTFKLNEPLQEINKIDSTHLEAESTNTHIIDAIDEHSYVILSKEDGTWGFFNLGLWMQSLVEKMKECCGGSDQMPENGWRGTDNGTDIENGVKIKYPLLACWDAKSDGDTILVKTLYSIEDDGNGGTVRRNVKELKENGEGKWSITIDDWCKCFFTPNSGYCDLGMLAFEFLNQNTSNSIRKALLTFETDDEYLPTSGDCSGWNIIHGGEKVASTWEFEIWQAPKNYYWCCKEDGSNVTLLPCGQDCYLGKAKECCSLIDDPIKYTITFNFNDGTTSLNQLEEGDIITYPVNTSGYKWPDDKPTVMPAYNISITEVLSSTIPEENEIEAYTNLFERVIGKNITLGGNTWNLLDELYNFATIDNINETVNVVGGDDAYFIDFSNNNLITIKIENKTSNSFTIENQINIIVKNPDDNGIYHGWQGSYNSYRLSLTDDNDAVITIPSGGAAEFKVDVTDIINRRVVNSSDLPCGEHERNIELYTKDDTYGHVSNSVIPNNLPDNTVITSGSTLTLTVGNSVSITKTVLDNSNEYQMLSDDNKRKIVVSWMMALALNEIFWENYRTELFLIAYNEYNVSYYYLNKIFYYYKPSSDPLLLRTLATVLYSRYRGLKESIIETIMNNCRQEMGTSIDTQTDLKVYYSNSGEIYYMKLDQENAGDIYPNFTDFLPDAKLSNGNWTYDNVFPVKPYTDSIYVDSEDGRIGYINRYDEDNKITQYVLDNFDFNANQNLAGTDGEKRGWQAINDMTLSPSFITYILKRALNGETSALSGSDYESQARDYKSITDADWKYDVIYVLLEYCNYAGNDGRDGFVWDPPRVRPGSFDSNYYKNGSSQFNLNISGANTLCDSNLRNIIYLNNYCSTGNMPMNSYPSGHSSYSFMDVCLLIELYPNEWKNILKRGWDFSLNRVVTRWHWQSDVIIGRLVGGCVIPRLHTFDKFRKLFDVIKTSLKLTNPREYYKNIYDGYNNTDNICPWS